MWGSERALAGVGVGEGNQTMKRQNNFFLLNQQVEKGALARKQLSGKEDSGVCCRS